MKLNKIAAVAAIAAIMAGCSQEQSLMGGEGKIFLSARIKSDVKVEQRAAAEDELAASTQIWISTAEGVVRKYDSLNDVPTQGVKLLAGDYAIQAWAGKASYASFTDRWFEGEEQVTLANGDAKSVTVTCKITNVVASVKYADGIDDLISDYTLTIGHRGGSLDFEGQTDRKGYYIMPEGDTTLDWTLTATTDGHQFTKSGTIEGVQPAHEYVLNIAGERQSAEMGGAWITIEVDDTMVESEDEIVITTPPAITGYGFDLSAPVAGESGSIGRKSVYVSAASEFKEVLVSGLEGIEDLDLCRATAEVLAEVAAKGVSHEVTDADGGQMMKIIFEDTYTNALPNRDEPYMVTITAKDSGNKVTTATLTLKVSEAPIITADAPDDQIGFNTAVLRATVAKDVESAGFEYRQVGSADWQYVAANASRAAFNRGDVAEATVSGLPFDAQIEYRAVSGTADDPTQFRADIVKFSVKPTPQLPNKDLEQWSNTGTKDCIVPCLNYSSADQFWDCGNHGSITMNKNVTESTTEKSHGGKAAKLVSQFVGIGSIGKFACGNIVVGKYLATEGTNGVFGFGKPFDFGGLRPKALRLWVHYTPQKVTKAGSNSPTLKVGDMDQGHIFIALFDDVEEYAGYTAPYVVRTKDSRAFNKNNPNIVAYGERIFTEATAGNSLMEIEIPIEYYSQTRQLKYIAIICAASKEGDYFTGGEGTTMYVDDFTLVY